MKLNNVGYCKTLCSVSTPRGKAARLEDVPSSFIGAWVGMVVHVFCVQWTVCFSLAGLSFLWLGGWPVLVGSVGLDKEVWLV